jgi:hypothetical protein
MVILCSSAHLATGIDPMAATVIAAQCGQSGHDALSPSEGKTYEVRGNRKGKKKSHDQVSGFHRTASSVEAGGEPVRGRFSRSEIGGARRSTAEEKKSILGILCVKKYVNSDETDSADLFGR